MVVYRSNVTGKDRECVGHVVAHYPGYKYWSDEDGEVRTVPDHVGVRVTCRPSWWPYPDTDRFAPEIADLIEC